jgi:hypothetical protein
MSKRARGEEEEEEAEEPHADHLANFDSVAGRELVCDDELHRADCGWIRMAIASTDLDRPDIFPIDWLGRGVVDRATTPVTRMCTGEILAYANEMNWYLSGDPTRRRGRVTDEFRRHLELVRARFYFFVKYETYAAAVDEEHRRDPSETETCAVNCAFVTRADSVISEMDLVLSVLRTARVVGPKTAPPTAAMHDALAAIVRRTDEAAFMTYRQAFEADLRATPADWRVYRHEVPENHRPTAMAVLAYRDATLTADSPMTWAEATTPAARNDPRALTADAVAWFIFNEIVDVVVSRVSSRRGLFVLRFASTWFVADDDGTWAECECVLHALCELRARWIERHGATIYRAHEPDPARPGARVSLVAIGEVLGL